MTSNRDRQRAAARARLEREMTQRAEAARRRRRLQAIIGAGLGVVVVVGGVVWLSIALGGDKKDAATPEASASPTPTTCQWTPVADPSAPPGQGLPPHTKDVGTPPATGEPRSGTQTMTVTTTLGVIKIEMDTSKTPCTSASFAHLASKKYFDNAPCHRLTTEGIHVLQCGDPSGTGQGGPAYRYADENLPTGRRPAYPEGAVAMANGGPGTNGSQFFILFKDSELPPNYTLLGRVTEGMDIVKQVGEAGHDGAYEPNPGGGKPKKAITITTLAVSPAAG